MFVCEQVTQYPNGSSRASKLEVSAQTWEEFVEDYHKTVLETSGTFERVSDNEFVSGISNGTIFRYVKKAEV